MEAENNKPRFKKQFASNNLEIQSNNNATNQKDNNNTPSFYDIKEVLIIYTGGTFGMAKTENGYTPRKNFMFDYMLHHPVLCDKEFTQKYTNKDFSKNGFLSTPKSELFNRTNYKIIEFDYAIDSSNMNLAYWKKIAGSLRENYDHYNAFIIIHGTDTMSYTSCILSFILENLNKTVILTGAQIPLIEMRNDSLKNLADSLIIAGNYHIPEVTILFNSKLMRANRAIKDDNINLNAFYSPNFNNLVELGVTPKVNWNLILEPSHENFSCFDVK